MRKKSGPKEQRRGGGERGRNLQGQRSETYGLDGSLLHIVTGDKRESCGTVNSGQWAVGGGSNSRNPRSQSRDLGHLHIVTGDKRGSCGSTVDCVGGR